MAVTEQLLSQKATLQLNGGQSATGVVRKVGVSLGTLSDTGWDAEKAERIFDAVGSLMDMGVYRHDRTVTYYLENS